MSLQQDFQLGNDSLLNFTNISDQEREMVRHWRNHNDTRKWMYSDHLITKEEHARFLKKLQEGTRDVFWIVKNKENGYIGVVYLNRLDFNNRNAYLGLYTNPDCRLSGVGYRLLECLKELAFDHLNLHTLKLEVLRANIRAQNLYKGLGFCKRRHTQRVCVPGRWMAGCHCNGAS